MSENTEIINPFPGNSYDTPPDTKRSLIDRLMLGCRASFYLRNFYVFYRSGYLCRTTVFDGNPQTQHSLMNIRITESCGGKFHLRGLDNISGTDRPVIFIGNHMSLLETAVMHAFIRPRKKFCFVIKESLMNVPYFGDIMKTLGCITVGRANPRDDFKHVLEEGRRQIEKGNSIVIFPQSTRSAVFDESAFNTIGVKLAKHANAPIIPFALKTDFLENGRILKDLGPVRREKDIWFEFAEPIFPVKGSGKEEHAQIIAFIKERLAAWGGSMKEPEK